MSTNQLKSSGQGMFFHVPNIMSGAQDSQLENNGRSEFFQIPTTMWAAQDDPLLASDGPIFKMKNNGIMDSDSEEEDDADDYDLWLDPEVAGAPWSNLKDVQRTHPLPKCKVSPGLDDRWGRADYHLAPLQLRELETSVKNGRARRLTAEKRKALIECLSEIDRLTLKDPHLGCEVIEKGIENPPRESRLPRLDTHGAAHTSRLMDQNRNSASSHLSATEYPELKRRSISTRGSETSQNRSSARNSTRGRPESTATTSSSVKSWGMFVKDKLTGHGLRPGSPTGSELSFACEHARAIEKGEVSAEKYPVYESPAWI